MKDKIKSIQGHQWTALVIAGIVILAEIVIVYELQLAGAWLVPGWLSWAKTIAFILLFVGSLIGEVQTLAPRVRWLLFAAVVILSAYQAITNVVVNYYGASIPPAAIAFFGADTDPLLVKWWVAVVDGLVRTLVVVLMWLVTGLVWRGVAVATTAPQADVERMQAELAQAHTEIAAARAAVATVSVFAALPQKTQVQWIAEHRNGEGPNNTELASLYGVNPGTISRWINEK